MSSISWKSVDWPVSAFLIGTLLVALTAVPAYVGYWGLGTFQWVLFLFFFAATGLSITLGYHRLLSHRSFQAAWPVRCLVLLFGAAAFEHSALRWAADHRRHHKFVDQEEDPYDISKGFFHAHIGWLLRDSQPSSSLDLVKDLQRDRLVVWQHRYYYPLSVFMGFALPALLGFLGGGAPGALGGFLVAGVARVVLVQHFTFFINSLCHSIGRRPYSSSCTARDSAIMAWFTFGEGYHNFHHAFQHDYRNGVKPWQFDPTKWLVWLLHLAGLTWDLRRVPAEKILLAESLEQQRSLAAKLQASPTPLPETIRSQLHAAQMCLQEAFLLWEQRQAAYGLALEKQLEASRETLAELRRELHRAREFFRTAMRNWQRAHRLVHAQLAA